MILVALVQPVGPATVDWQRGVLEVEAGAAPSLRAPNPGVARVGAERAARQAATRKLLEAAAHLPVVGGGTVGDRLRKRPEARRWLEKTLDQVQPARVRYASDGGIELQVRLSLQKVARALAGDPEAAAAPAAGPGKSRSGAARIAICRSRIQPAILPQADLRFYATLAEAKKDERLGPHPQTIRIGKLSDGDLRGGPVAVVIEK
ncbi:MAG TPA: hypothetical protein VKN99_09860 [Polyangia bacterium]|nr:hypothetical protein [Polyangia bacterium]